MNAVAGLLGGFFPLSAQANTRHRFNGFQRIVTRGGFCREHDRIAAIQYRVSDVEDFSAGGKRR